MTCLVQRRCPRRSWCSDFGDLYLSYSCIHQWSIYSFFTRYVLNRVYFLCRNVQRHWGSSWEWHEEGYLVNPVYKLVQRFIHFIWGCLSFNDKGRWLRCPSASRFHEDADVNWRGDRSDFSGVGSLFSPGPDTRASFCRRTGHMTGLDCRQRHLPKASPCSLPIWRPQYCRSRWLLSVNLCYLLTECHWLCNRIRDLRWITVILLVERVTHIQNEKLTKIIFSVQLELAATQAHVGVKD